MPRIPNVSLFSIESFLFTVILNLGLATNSLLFVRIQFWKNLRADVTLPVFLPIFLLHFPLLFWGILLLPGKFVEKSTFWAYGRKCCKEWSLSPLQIWLRKGRKDMPPGRNKPQPWWLTGRSDLPRGLIFLHAYQQPTFSSSAWLQTKDHLTFLY